MLVFNTHPLVFARKRVWKTNLNLIVVHLIVLIFLLLYCVIFYIRYFLGI